jgi:hypothetical protein
VRTALGLLLVAAVAAALAVVSGAGTEPGHRALELKTPPAAHSVLAFQHGKRTTWLRRVDSRTLRYQKGRRLDVGGYGSGWSFSPDRSLLALGDMTFGRVLLVDSARLRGVRLLDTGVRAHVSATAWLGSRLLAVLEGCCEEGRRTTLVNLDRTSCTVLSRVDLAGSLEAVARTGSELVLLLGPTDGVGPSRLAVAYADGHLRTAGVGRIHSGRETETAGALMATRHARPGLAIDPAGNRAFVVGSGAPVAAVDLATLAVAYHELATPVSLLGRLRDWLEPTALAKTPPVGPVRSATWLGAGLIAVSGYDSDVWTDAAGNIQFRATPAGLKVIDTRSWTMRTIDASATDFEVADGLLIASGLTWNSAWRRHRGKGLTAYDERGAVRFHLFGSQPVLDVQRVGTRIVVRRDVTGKATALVDLRRGRVVRLQMDEPPVLVTGPVVSEF